MKVRLADVGDPLAQDMFSIGRNRARLRGPDGGGGGGTGGDGGGDDSGDGDDADDDADDDSDDGDEDDSDDKGGDDKDDKKQKNPELEKAIRARDRAKERARKLQEELDKTKNKDDKPDPVAVANAKLVRAEAKTVLAAAGVTDKDDVSAVLEVLKLDDIEVDADGEPDADTIEERVADLRRIFGGSGKPPARKVPKGTSARDKGGNNTSSTDTDSARYKNFLGHR